MRDDTPLFPPQPPVSETDRWWQVYCAALSGLVARERGSNLGARSYLAAKYADYAVDLAEAQGRL